MSNFDLNYQEVDWIAAQQTVQPLFPKGTELKASQILHTRLIPSAERVVGATLAGVGYRVLKYEASADNIKDPDFYLGGEIELRFDNLESLYVSWDQNAGWDDGTIFSLLLTSRTSSTENSLEEFSANTTKVWTPHIGKSIESASILGINDVPFVLALQTTAGRVFLGSSYQDQFGDGDDVFDSTDPRNISLMSPLWQSCIEA